MRSERSSILVVDDEPSIRETTAALLEDDFDIVQCASAELALRALRHRPFDVVCTDFKMPGMNGIELLREAKKVYTSIAGIVITAYADYPSYQSELHSLSCLVLLKPYDASALLDLVSHSARIARTKRLSLDAVTQAARIKGAGGGGQS